PGTWSSTMALTDGAGGVLSGTVRSDSINAQLVPDGALAVDDEDDAQRENRDAGVQPERLDLDSPVDRHARRLAHRRGRASLRHRRLHVRHGQAAVSPARNQVRSHRAAPRPRHPGVLRNPVRHPPAPQRAAWGMTSGMWPTL